MAEPDDDAKLREVKVVLARLQRMSSDPESYFADQDDEEAAGIPPDRRPAARFRALLISGGTLVLALLALSSFYVLDLIDKRPDGGVPAAAVAEAPPQHPAEPRSASPAPNLPSAGAAVLATPPPASDGSPGAPSVAGAMRLIASGQVQSGRTLLRSLAAGRMTAEIAWSLARSYDPNLLSAIPSADGAPDLAEAEKWYREWHALALKEGLVPGTSSVDRILRTLK